MHPYGKFRLILLSGRRQAFCSFGGTPRTVVFDRMPTAVVCQEEDGRAVSYLRRSSS